MDNNYIVEQYIKNPVHNYPMEDFTIKQHEGNALCDDDITVYLHIQDNKITKYSFDGDCSNITRAAAGFLGDIIIDQDIDTVLQWDYQTFKNHDFHVSPRRKRAATIALLASKNAIHTYKKD